LRKWIIIAGIILLAISAFLFILRTLNASRIEVAGAAGQGLGFSFIGILLLVFGIILIVVGVILPPSKKEDSFRMGY
jgi:hypothetical protein